MNIAIMGAGAVGGYYGAMLARAGHRVTLIARPQHVAAVRSQGLILEMHGESHAVPVLADTSPAAVADAELILFCVKSTDTQSAGESIAPYLADGVTVLSLQNGVDNAERLQPVLGREVVPAVVYVAVEMVGPGHVRHHGRGELVIGQSATSEAIAAVLRDAGVPTEVSDNAIGALWAKMILNCAYNALSAVVQVPYGELVRGVGVTEVMRDVVAECLAVADALGVTVPGDVPASVARIAETMPTQYSSTAQDLARGKPSEIDYLNGYIVRQGVVLGVPTPANRVLHTMVKLAESRADRGTASVL
jgi:2-dehydropantoate 2-reductase